MRVLTEALRQLPAGVEKLLRSIRRGISRSYCATAPRAETSGRGDQFAVVTAEFRRAVSEVAEQDSTLYRKVGEHRVDTGQQWAEVGALQEQP